MYIINPIIKENICITCEYFKLPKNVDVQYGKCTKFFYKPKKNGYAVNAFNYICHGTAYSASSAKLNKLDDTLQESNDKKIK
jgi:hypothetical protein